MWRNDIEPIIMADESLTYASRTEKNAKWSDITLAFAVNPESQGELETRNAAGSKYLGVKLPEPQDGDGIKIDDPAFMEETAHAVVSWIKARDDFQSINRKGILINVAGNRLSILERSGIDQKMIDNLLEHVLRTLMTEGINIEEIRSGGQSGVDEAAIHAAQRLGKTCSILCPGNYRFSDSKGVEHSGYQAFAARFQTNNDNSMKQKNYSFLQLLLSIIFTVALLLSNIIVGKQISLPFGASTVGSVILFPLTYILSDIFSEVYGYRWSRVTCYLAFAMNIVMVLIFELLLALPFPDSFTAQSSFEAVLGSVPRITAASLIAYVIGDFANDRVFRTMKRHHINENKGFAVRAIFSSIVGEFTDCLVFLPLAFIGTLPFRTLVSIGIAQVAVKIVLESVLLPVTTVTVKAVQRAEDRLQQPA